VVEANNYDMVYDADLGQIIAKSRLYLFVFLPNGAIVVENKAVDTTIIARDLFYYLLHLAASTNTF
jgi:hypothetical protein